MFPSIFGLSEAAFTKPLPVFQTLPCAMGRGDQAGSSPCRGKPRAALEMSREGWGSCSLLWGPAQGAPAGSLHQLSHRL